MLMQLQDLLTSVTSSERCSISRGCEHDQVGTALSSSGYKGRVACDRTLPPTEKHQLLFTGDGCCPFSSTPLFKSWFFFLESGLHLFFFCRSQILCSSGISFECTQLKNKCPRRCSGLQALPGLLCSSVRNIRVQVSRAWCISASESGVGGPPLQTRRSAREDKGRARASPFDSSTRMVGW